ncbi:hypothetical protein ACO0RG_001178 [Hanseniaspora osmophila]|uniref:Actin-related protein 5 n=1 Tax=Hanseniaspora osmophila TaxID=56408 RepID=A0A1E5RNP8_9ASCO|nr:Actin-related protein 5 [Hanseniaspora osmophila]
MTYTADRSLSPLPVHSLNDAKIQIEPEPYDSESSFGKDIPIAIDFGTYSVKAGYTNKPMPSHDFSTLLSRWRDRKAKATYTFIGNDTDLDPSIKSQSKSPYDGSFITNWDYVEEILEYTFDHLSVQGSGGVPNPILMTEKLAAIAQQRSNWYQLLFECFEVPKVTFGIDSLYSFYQNTSTGNDTGLVIGSGHEETDVIPVINGKGVIQESKRLNWGGAQSVDYLSNLLTLKYPYFPDKLSNYQFESMYKDFSYISPNYHEEINNVLELDNLESKDIVVESPFQEVLLPTKTEEELAAQAERKKQLAKKLQEQARVKRQEKLIQKQEEYEYYSEVREKWKSLPKAALLKELTSAGFDDEADFKKYVSGLEKALARARQQEDDENDGPEEPEQEPQFELVDIPDTELNEDQIKEKRKQRLMKANFEARKRMKEEKLKRLQEKEEAERRDMEWRKSNLKEWVHDKRSKLAVLLKSRKDKLKMKEDMKDRKSAASQMRMKNLASLADDVAIGNKRTRQQATIDNDPNDTFGTNDDDWAVYRDVASNPELLDEILDEEYKKILELEQALLEHDPNFTEEDTVDAQYDWRKSTLHLFLRGPRPHDSEDPHEQHQLHLNVERIRVPEVLFQPSIAGLDQAGISELSKRVLLGKFGARSNQLSEVTKRMAQNVLLTGGNTKIKGLRERVVKEFTEFLPVGTKLHVYNASNPELDAWRGMKKYAESTDYQNSFVTKKQYEELGSDYIKEHKLGNIKYYD